MPRDQFLRGDAKGIDGGLYQIPLTIARAQVIVDELRQEFDERLPVVVIAGRRTRRRYGFTRRPISFAHARNYIIVLHPIGLNLGTLFHEFAHVICPVRGHGPIFKRTQKAVIRYWTTRAATRPPSTQEVS